MPNMYDAIVVGGGHNGLVAAAYLAKSGARTVVLEGRHKTGGAATTESPWPDAPEFKVTRLSYVMSLMPPTIIEDLQLERHGYKVYPMGPYYQAFPEGGSIKHLRRRRQAQPTTRSPEVVARRTPTRWREVGRLARPGWPTCSARCCSPCRRTLGSHEPGDLDRHAPARLAHRGLDVRTVADVTRLMTMSIADLLDDWFESPQVKGALAVNGVIGTWAGPYEPGTAYVMAHHSIGDVGDGHLGNWGFPEGGMGAVADAIRRCRREQSAREVRTDARVAGLIVRGRPGPGRRPGERRGAAGAVVVTSLHPRTAFLDQVGARATCPTTS